MCFGGGSKPQATQAPAPTPAPTPSETAPQQTADERRKKISMSKYGMASTIKTSPQGIAGAGVDLTSTGNQGKKTLGA